MTDDRGESRLAGKVAVVTGAGTGIGRAIATVFAIQGAKVVLTGRRRQPLDSAAEEVRQTGGEAAAVPGDMTSAADVRRLVEVVHASYGPVDVLVNNAGAMVTRTNVLDCTEADWLRTIDLNLHGVYQCSKAFLPDLIGARGNIVNVASVFGLLGAADAAAYSASKGAVISLTRAMAMDLGRHGVRVNALCPAYVETDMNRAMLDRLRERGEFAVILNRLPLGTLGATQDVANAALFLGSDESRWITGVALPVDGGMSAGRA